MRVNKLVTKFKRTNVYIYFDEKTRKGVVIDPGGDSKIILTLLEENHIELEGILLTHGHYDHIYDVHEVKAYNNAKVYAMKEEAKILESPNMNMSYKIAYEEVEKSSLSIIPDVLLKDGDVLELANTQIKVIHTPGHTVGSCVFYDEKENILFSGDTLFKDNIGRTDLPSGNQRTIIDSVMNKLFILPNETIVYPGHYDETIIEVEKRINLVNKLFLDLDK